MAIPHRAPNHGTYFITSSTYNRRRLFQTTAHAELLLETLQHYRREGCYRLYAFVIMPDHKGGFSRRLASKLPIWQRGFTDHRIRDRKDFETRRDYIHHNPARARLCQLPEDFPHSSAHSTRRGTASEPVLSEAERMP